MPELRLAEHSGRAEALASYREALRAWQGLGLVWDEALCSIDMATVLDASDGEVRAAADAGRAILARLGAGPMLERLDSALARPQHVGKRTAGPAARTEDRTPV